MTDEKFEFMQDCRDRSITARSARNKRTHNGKGGRVRFPSDNLTKKEREAMNGECVSYRMNEPIIWADFKNWPEEHQKTYILLLRKKYNVPDKYIAEMMGVHAVSLCKHLVKIGLGTGSSSGPSKKKKGSWDREGFYAWRGLAKDGAVEASETPIEEDTLEKTPVDIPEHVFTPEERDGLIAVNDEPELVIQEEVQISPNDEAEAMYEAFKKSIAECKPVAVPTNIYEGSYNYMPVIPKSGSMTFEHNNADDALATIKALLSNIKVNITVSWESVT